MARSGRRLRHPGARRHAGRGDRGRLLQRGGAPRASAAAADAVAVAAIVGGPGSRLDCGSPRSTADACPKPHRSDREMGFFSYLTGMGGRDMAVDLGTANTLV